MLPGDWGDEEEEGAKGVPPKIDFMLMEISNVEKFRASWHETPTEFCLQWGVGNDPRLSLNEVEPADYKAKYIADVFGSEGIVQ